jgi:Fe-S cluster assembly iron-binding protein IscA
MLTVTKAALAAIKEHLCQHNIDSTIRITMMGGCCIGENLRFTVCEKQPNDLSFTFDSTVFLIDRELAAQCGAVKVDFAEKYDHCPCSGRNGGFSISSERFSFRCGGTGGCEQCTADCAESAADACKCA